MLPVESHQYSASAPAFNLPHLHLEPPLGTTPYLSFRKIFGTRNLETLGIVWRCLRDPTFSRFSRTLTCDRPTDRQTHDGSWHPLPALASVARVKPTKKHEIENKCHKTNESKQARVVGGFTLFLLLFSPCLQILQRRHFLVVLLVFDDLPAIFASLADGRRGGLRHFLTLVLLSLCLTQLLLNFKPYCKMLITISYLSKIYGYTVL